ncbi:hypothetical protein H2200_010364 [Cladophialophora chaetospira]|uniref:Uncharacterized protein n=1 Tax=Cladophialophora chaetospira TaxID=386627 RepID=A0AA38X1F0_9EURO|nr:hypothetical protein H2200_010364 [Cladophialophora chaetospira]
MGLKMESFDDDMPDDQVGDSGSHLNGPDLEKTIQSWQSTLDMLREYKTELVNIVADHPDLTPENRASILESLLAQCEIELTDAEVVVAANASGMSIAKLLTVTQQVGCAKVVLLMKAADLEMVETARYANLGSALSRLRRTEAFYRCVRQLRDSREGGLCSIYGDQAATDIFERMLANTGAVKLVEVERFTPHALADVACAICQETEVKSIITWCQSILSPCCKVPVHGCCMELRVREVKQDCPRYRYLFSEEDMAAMIHERTFQLEEGMRTCCYEECERMQAAIRSA